MKFLKKNKIREKIQVYKESPLFKKKLFILVIFLILMINYLLICYHIDRNPFALFPSWPITDSREKVNLYFPSLNVNSLLKESRLIEKTDDKKNFIREMVTLVIKGSNFENTRAAVPIKGKIRKIWLYKNICIVDFYFESLNREVKLIKGSEKNFKNAIARTITENLPEIKKVYILSKGIYNKEMWEFTKN